MNAHKSPIEHIIVLMMENRSYDHMLGYLPNGYGLTGQEYNLVDPADPTSEKVYVNDRAGYITPINPAHDVVSVERNNLETNGRASKRPTDVVGEPSHVGASHAFGECCEVSPSPPLQKL